MNYSGAIVPVLVGHQGIQTDIAQAVDAPAMPYGYSSVSLLSALNCNLRYEAVEKAPGSVKWNSNVLPAGIAGGFDWWPNDYSQRMIVACKDGNIYRFINQKIAASIVQPGSGAPAKLNLDNQCHIIQGGSEGLGNNRKLFIFSGNDPIQVISGDGTTRNSLSKPNPDWGNNNWPTFGVMHNNALWVTGCQKNPHTWYRSSVLDHEDFATSPGSTTITVTVFPGEYQGCMTGYVFKERLYTLKYPKGLYLIDDSASPDAPGVYKVSDSFGAGSRHCAIQVLNDMLIGNSSGSVSSLQASLNLGNMEQGDLMKELRCIKFVLENTNAGAVASRQAIYYEEKKQALFSCQSPSGFKPDRILMIDYHSLAPAVSFYDKDQPNCLFLVRDYRNIERPFYGSDDGYVYQMDSPNFSVGGTPYGGNAYIGSFQLPHLDFGFLEKGMEEKDKIFDFLGVTCEPTANQTLQADVFIDGKFSQTVQITTNNKRYLDGQFSLDQKRFPLAGMAPTAPRVVPIRGMGKRISVRFSQAGLGVGFRISSVQFYFRPGGVVNR